MHIVVIAWIYVVVLMSVIEAASNQGSLLGAFTTLLLYGVLPLGLLMYLKAGSARRSAQCQHEQHRHEHHRHGTTATTDASGKLVAPDRGEHAAGNAIAPKREEA